MSFCYFLIIRYYGLLFHQSNSSWTRGFTGKKRVTFFRTFSHPLLHFYWFWDKIYFFLVKQFAAIFFFFFFFLLFFFLLSKTFEGWLKWRFWYLIINLWRLDSLVEIYLDISSITKGKVCLFTNLFGTSYLKHFITPPSCLFLSRKYGCLNP